MNNIDTNYGLQPHVDALTKPWIEVYNDNGTLKTHTHTQSLIELLHDAISSNNGNTGGGGTALANERNLIDTAAFTLYERIRYRIIDWLDTTGHTADRNPTHSLPQLATTYDTLWKTGQLPQNTYERIIETVEQWRQQIIDQFDPPTTKELKAACPHCGTTYIQEHIDGETIRSYAIRTIIWPTQHATVTALCRQCGHEWTGNTALIELGQLLGIEPDHNTLNEIRLHTA